MQSKRRKQQWCIGWKHIRLPIRSLECSKSLLVEALKCSCNEYSNQGQDQYKVFLRCWTTYFKNKVPSASASRSPSLHDRIHKLIEPIKPYIFGETPMCKA